MSRKKRSCKICGADVPQNVAAHDCPHGVQCRYRLRPDGSVLDWETPDCDRCEKAATRPRLVLSPKALALLEEGDSNSSVG